MQNTGGFKFCLQLNIKHRILKIFKLKTFKAFILFNRGFAYAYQSLW